MAKYALHRLGSVAFQELVQALLEQNRRNAGELVQFGSAGADGAREATWTQSPTHPDYIRPETLAFDAPKHWVFQVKFHDLDLRGWDRAAGTIVSELKAELSKVHKKHEVPCHHFVLITNVPLTGVRRIGTRDKVLAIADEWRDRIPNVEVWDAADLSRMLDNCPQVRQTYEDLITPGDVLAAIRRETQIATTKRETAFRGYLTHLLDNEAKARAEEAGDEDALPLVSVFVDQSMRLDTTVMPTAYAEVVAHWKSESSRMTGQKFLPSDLSHVSVSFPLLWAAQDKVMILAGPGYGKSTITQFLALYHAGRILNDSQANILGGRLKLPEGWSPKDLDSACPLRFPFRIELKRYAKWRKSKDLPATRVGIALYIADQLIGGAIDASLDSEDIFALVASNPCLLILDGLDEVPSKEDRDQIVKDCDAFFYRCVGAEVDLQVVLSSRPQGYHGEFDRFQPIRWIINDLSEDTFYEYGKAWLTERIKNTEERAEAEERIRRSMTSPAVKSLATTLLQATVMLTIAKRKNDIPEERFRLFEKYVEVVFQREKLKSDFISHYESELKLLHEVVGYQIHTAVGRGEAVGIREERFKELVLQVWSLIHGDDPFTGVLNNEIAKIFTLATDRLVFLTGKGKNQTDIDFVIQPYREYFTSTYLLNHAEADAERVLLALVARGAYWQQVFRFYIASGTPAQQSSWIFGIDRSPSGIDDYSSVIRDKRAVIFALPEFNRFQYEHVKKTLRIALPIEEWWAWIGQEWIIPVLRTVGRGSGWRELWKTYVAHANPGYGIDEFAIWLFPYCIPRTSDEFGALIHRFDVLLAQGKNTEGILEAAFTHKLPVTLHGLDTNILTKSALHASYQDSQSDFNALLEMLPPDAAMRLICTSFTDLSPFDHKILWEKLGIPTKEKEVLVSLSDGRFSERVALGMPYWARLKCQAQAEWQLGMDESTPDARYIKALAKALQNPEDSSADSEARRLAGQIPGTLEWTLRPEVALGPASRDFASLKNWVDFKRGVAGFFDSKENVEALAEIPNTLTAPGANPLWCVLCINPSNWHLLVERDLLTFDDLKRIRNTHWAELSVLSDNPSPIHIHVRPFPVESHVDPQYFFTLVKLMVEIHNTRGLPESEFISNAQAFVDLAALTSTQLNEIVIERPDEMPESLAGVIMAMLLACTDPDLMRTVSIWKGLRGDRRRLLWFGYRLHRRDFVEKLVLNLLSLRDINAAALAIDICKYVPEMGGAIAMEFAKIANQKTSWIESDEKDFLTLCDILQKSQVSIGELELYADNILFRRMIHSCSDVIPRSVQCMGRILQSVDSSEFGKVRLLLLRIAENRREYPIETAAAAIDALVQLEINECAPLCDSDWRCQSVS